MSDNLEEELNEDIPESEELYERLSMIIDRGQEPFDWIEVHLGIPVRRKQAGDPTPHCDSPRSVPVPDMGQT